MGISSRLCLLKSTVFFWTGCDGILFSQTLLARYKPLRTAEMLGRWFPPWSVQVGLERRRTRIGFKARRI
jgi:hypothetical protein